MEIDCEEQSLRNMVSFYREELRQIEEGVPAVRFFGFERLRILTGEYRLLRLMYDGGRKYVLTEKAKILLKEIEEEEIASAKP